MSIIRKGHGWRPTWVALEVAAVAVGVVDILEIGREINCQCQVQHLAKSRAHTLIEGRNK